MKGLLAARQNLTVWLVGGFNSIFLSLSYGVEVASLVACRVTKFTGFRPRATNGR